MSFNHLLSIISRLMDELRGKNCRHSTDGINQTLLPATLSQCRLADYQSTNSSNYRHLFPQPSHSMFSLRLMRSLFVRRAVAIDRSRVQFVDGICHDGICPMQKQNRQANTVKGTEGKEASLICFTKPYSFTYPASGCPCDFIHIYTMHTHTHNMMLLYTSSRL